MCAPFFVLSESFSEKLISNFQNNVSDNLITHYALRIANCELDIANSVNAAACFFLPEKQAPQVVFSCGALTIKKL